MPRASTITLPQDIGPGYAPTQQLKLNMRGDTRLPFGSESEHAVRQQTILVVESNPIALSETVNLLRSSGYVVAQATGFEEANRILAIEPPRLLVTGLKLAAYNGLHLIFRAHAKHPAMAAIVINDAADAVLEAEAARQGARYMIKPCESRDFLELIRQSLESDVPQGIDVRFAPQDDCVAMFPRA